MSHQFDARVAEGDLRRYRRKGPNLTTRMLRDLVSGAPRGRTVLDVGAGVGALSFELLGSGFHLAKAVEPDDETRTPGFAVRIGAPVRELPGPTYLGLGARVGDPGAFVVSLAFSPLARPTAGPLRPSGPKRDNAAL